MNKRQKKKRKTKYLPVIADEGNLLTMTDDEREKAHKEYIEFIKKYAYRKKYKNLKGKYLRYFYGIGEQYKFLLTKIVRYSTGKMGRTIEVTQNLSDFEKAYSKGGDEKLVLGSTCSGKTPMLISGLDLCYLLTLLRDQQITIIELGKQILYEGIAGDYTCKRVEYEIVKFEKIFYDNSYSIIVKKIR